MNVNVIFRNIFNQCEFAGCCMTKVQKEGKVRKILKSNFQNSF